MQQKHCRRMGFEANNDSKQQTLQGHAFLANEKRDCVRDKKRSLKRPRPTIRPISIACITTWAMTLSVCCAEGTNNNNNINNNYGHLVLNRKYVRRRLQVFVPSFVFGTTTTEPRESNVTSVPSLSPLTHSPVPSMLLKGNVTYNSQDGIVELFPSPVPTETFVPSPSPTSIPTQNPTLSAHPSAAPSEIPTDTSQPSPSPSTMPSAATTPPTVRPTTQEPSPNPTTLAPTPSPTPRPTPQPTPLPTFAPTMHPTTSAPTPSPTPLPSARPSWHPSSSPTASPTLPPTTTQPTRAPTDAPSNRPTPRSTAPPSLRGSAAPTLSIFPTTSQPSVSPTRVPSAPPTLFPTRTTAPSTSAPTMAPSQIPSTMPSLEIVAPVPLTPFGLSLTFPQPLGQAQAETVAQELQVAVADYLVQGLSNVNFGDGVTLQSVGLNVTAPNVTSASGLRRRRRLQQQQQQLSYNVDGSAQFGNTGQTRVNPGNLAQNLDSSLQALLNDPNKQGSLTAFLQLHPNSQVLQSTSTAAASVPTSPPGERRPTVVAIVFGFLLVGLALASLLFYLHCWCKKLRKKRKERQREREGVVASTPPRSPARPPVVPGFLATSVTRSKDDDGVEESSEDDSSYAGVSEGSSDFENDAFARELKLAATLDRRAWEDYQQRKQQLEKDGMVVGRSPNRKKNDSFGDEDDDGEGIEVTEQGATLIIGPVDPPESPRPPPMLSSNRTTFPYGDEVQQDRSPRDKGSNPPGRSPQKGVDNGVEWGAEEIVSIAPNTSDKENGFQASPEKAPSPEKNPARGLLRLFSSNTDAVAARARKRHIEPEEQPELKRRPESSPSTTPRSSPVTISSSLVVQESPPSSLNGPVPRSSPATTIVMGNNSRDLADEEKESPKRSEPFLAFEIVKEVRKLSQFVKGYEQRREKEKIEDFSDELDDASMTDSSQHSWSSDSRNFLGLMESHDEAENRGVMLDPLEDNPVDDSSEATDPEEAPPSEKGSDESRLGITPFQVSTLVSASAPEYPPSPRVSARNRDIPLKPVPPPIVSKPPPTGGLGTQLSPIPGTPRTPEESHVFRFPDQADNVARGSALSPASDSRSPRRNGHGHESPGLLDMGAPMSTRQLDSIEDSAAAKAEDGRPQPRLRSLRAGDAILDGDSDLDTAPSDETSGRQRNNSDPLTPKQERPVMQSPPSSQKRSKNKAFSNILSMFENKTQAAIFPPSESWQYNY